MPDAVTIPNGVTGTIVPQTPAPGSTPVPFVPPVSQDVTAVITPGETTPTPAPVPGEATKPNDTIVTSDEPWYSKLDESMHDTAKRFKSQNEMVKSYTELERKMSETRPGEVAPKDVSEYKFEPGEGVQYDDGMLDSFKADALALGFSTDQFEGLMRSYEGVINQQADFAADYEGKQQVATMNALKEEWGNENYENRIAEVNTTINKFGVADLLNEKGLGNDYEILKMFDDLTQRVGEDNSPEDTGKGKTWDARISAVRDKIDALPFGSRDRKPLEAQLDKMYKQRYPGK